MATTTHPPQQQPAHPTPPHPNPQPPPQAPPPHHDAPPPPAQQPEDRPPAPERPADADESAEALRNEQPRDRVPYPERSREDTIRSWAAVLWENAGRPPDRDEEFWHQAEAQMVREELTHTPGGMYDVREVGIPNVDDMAERESITGQPKE
jgi:hypothetical protein